MLKNNFNNNNNNNNIKHFFKRESEVQLLSIKLM
jgi:hypothetical protein